MTLYHFTCHEAAARIDDELMLRPNRHPYLDVPLVWLTDLDEAVVGALGLTRGQFITCDRTTNRYQVADESNVVRWSRFARSLDRTTRLLFEYTPGAMPAHWYVSTELVPVLSRERATA